MLLAVCALLAGLALGRLRGGSLESLGGLPLRGRRLAVAALLVQAVGTLVGGPFHPLGLAASAGLLVAFLAANRGVRGTGLVALGLLANAVVVVANGAMPVSERAAARAGLPPTALGADLDSRHELMDDATRLPLLGDVVPVPLPVRPEVVSPGDVLVAAGLAQLVVMGMQPGGGQPTGRQRPLPPRAALPGPLVSRSWRSPSRSASPRLAARPSPSPDASSRPRPSAGTSPRPSGRPS